MKLIKTFLLIVAVLMLVDFAFAQTWVQTSAPSTNWSGVAMSADGKRLVAVASPGGIFISTNSGVAWTQATNAPVTLPSSPFTPFQWSSVASSADGKKLVAASDSRAFAAAFPGWVYISTNSGVGWIQSSAPGGVVNWRSTASSADGKKLAAANNYGGNIYTSTNSGANWISNSAPATGWSGIASSTDGMKLTAVVYGGGIHTSTNLGAAWVSNNAPNKNWAGVAASADGKKLTAIVYGGGIYTSADSGTVWTQTTAPAKNWTSVASSIDGSKLAAAVRGGGIYLSTNSGTVWTQTSAPGTNWTSVASSADGSKLIGAVAGGGIYSSASPSAPLLNLTSSSNRLTFSWTVPATNFVVQQSSNLISWANVTNTPALNFTNLQNEVMLTPSNRSSFYRLKTP